MKLYSVLTTARPLAVLDSSMTQPARGAPVRAARPPPAVRRPNAGVRQEKERVRMMRGVSHATHTPVASPNPEVRPRNIQYCVQLRIVNVSTLLASIPGTLPLKDE